MTIEAIASLMAGNDVSMEALARAESAGAGGELYRTLVDNLEQLNSDLAAGKDGLQELALGNMDNLHQLVMGMERTRLQFDLLMSVRNRVLEAYQEILRMQV